MVRKIVSWGLALAFAISQPAQAEDAETNVPQCQNGECRIRLSASQLLSKADHLVSEHRFDEAAPLLAALENAPEFDMQRQFLIGYSDIETGKVDEAIKNFRSVLADHPDQTRVRLELARALMMKGKTLSADHHLRLIQEDQALPEEVSKTIYNTRNMIRSQRNWLFNVDLGFAPDSNITNGTSAESVDMIWGNYRIPLSLSSAAREHSGTGQFATISASARLGFIGETRLVIDGDSQLTNYRGKDFDDLSAQIAVGPEMDLGLDTTLAVQAVGSQRWYGGERANTGFGARATLQHNLSHGQRLGLSLDARRSESGFTTAYSGWQLGGYATYERVVSKSMIASASLFARREALNAGPFASTELGANLGVGGELPLGINAGISGGVSKAAYDKAMAIFSPKPRDDLRLNARVHVGLRSLRVVGFSPSITYNYSRSQSSLTLYDSERHRLRFALARYF